MQDDATLWTVGHGSRACESLLSLLTQAGIVTLVDIRAQPRSGRHPQFNETRLRDSCGLANIVYHWAGRHLGGRRAMQPDSPHLALHEDLRGFADHMGTEIFKKAIRQLVSLAAHAPTVMMCAERDPRQCHRSLIADYLTLQGMRVVHLIEAGEQREHLLSPLARRESAALIYDRQVNVELDLN